MPHPTKPTYYLIAALLALPAAAYAAGPNPASTALTIYNDNFAVVRGTIPFTLKAGVNSVTATGITAQVEPSSVILRDLSGHRDLRILEQDYRGDTVSQGLLLYLNEGKTIDFQVAGANGGPPTIVQGKIIRSGYAPGSQNNYNYNSNQSDTTPLIEVNGQLQFGLPGQPLFPALADNSILTPTLEWKIDADQPGPVNAELAYITGGMSWDAAYNLIAPVQGDTLDMTAWVTIDNESGKEFDNAQIKLMAGDVNKIHDNSNGYPRVLGADQVYANAADNSLSTQATEKPLDNYHLYTLPNPTDLQNHETKQVQFLRAPHVQSSEIYVYDGLQLDPNQYQGWGYDNIRSQQDYGTQSAPKVAVEREFVNSEANGLGVPLPAGRVRFYRRDQDGQLEFIGENQIDHTPKGETLRIATGDAFDLTGTRTQTEYTIDNNHDFLDESFSIVLKNARATPANIRVVEHLYRALNWTITTSSDKYAKTDAHTIEFQIIVPPSADKTLTYSAHYTW